MLRDEGITGNFEVVLVPTGELIHSKTHGGKGKCTTAREVEEIVVKIEEYLDSAADAGDAAAAAAPAAEGEK